MVLKSNLKPTAKIAVSKNVLKHYKFSNEDVIYLSDGTEFQIELFNPTSDIILAEIEINGKLESNGLILYPAQRVFLERSLNNNHKFKFITYNIEDTEENKEAIEKNGLITIKFFKESIPVKYRISHSFPPDKYDWFSPRYISPSILNPDLTIPNNPYIVTCSAQLETGIITKGEISKQEFININEKFEPVYFEKIDIRILPQSQQPVSSNDIKHRKYCSECGTKLREKDKYCFNCGSKI